MNTVSKVPLNDLLKRSREPVAIDPTAEYTELTVKLWGKGLVSRGKALGSDIGAARYAAREGQIVLSKIDARHGAIGVVPPELDGAIVSNDFPCFDIRDPQRVCADYLRWLTKSSHFVGLCKKASEGTTNRVRIKEKRFLNQKIALPLSTDQQAIAARLDALADKTRQLTAHLDAIEAAADQLLAQRFQKAIAGAPYRPMAEVAPPVRRNVDLDLSRTYPEVAVRSFGKGLFKKPDFDAAAATWQKPVWVKEGDLVLSNIKAWEGAIAVAEHEHEGHIASHRYITCVPNPEVLHVDFLAFFLLNPEGLERIGSASPGTADRNRTLSLKNLRKIEVPTPSIDQQLAFVTLQAKVNDLKAHHTHIRAANADLLPATLERLFSDNAA